MTHATATRPARIGTGPAHCALEDARDRANLSALCVAVACTPADVSADGIRIDMLRLFDFMRRRGYRIDHPARAPCQVRRGKTIWHVPITLPAGVSFVLGYCTPNTS